MAGIKQLRLSGPTLIQKRIGEFAGKSISIVLKDGMVMMGTLVKIEGSALVLKNMRLKTITYPLDAIGEIYFDEKA